MVITPPRLLDRLRDFLHQLDLPPLERIEPIGRTGCLVRHTLCFVGDAQEPDLRSVAEQTGDFSINISGWSPAHRDSPHVHPLVLTRQAWATGFAPLATEFAAAKILVSKGLPAPSGFHILPPNVLSEPASVSVASPPSAPLERDAALPGLARVMKRLGDMRLQSAGTHADNGRFLPSRSSWRAEWKSFAEAQRGQLHAAMGGLAVVTKLWAQVEAGIQLLPNAPLPTLVHFDLQPTRLRFDPRGTLVAIEGWSHALAGDALAGWAPLISTLSTQELATVLTASQTAGAVVQGRAASLGVYAATYALSQLRGACQQAMHAASEQSTLDLQRALAVAETVSAPGFVQTRLANATPAIHLNTPIDVASESIARRDTLDLRAVLAFGVAPLPPTDRAPHMLASLCANALAHPCSGSTEHLRGIGHAFLDAANLPTGTLHVDPVDDTWRADLVSCVRESRPATGPAVAIALAARACEAIDRLGDRIPDRSLRGLEAMVLSTTAASSIQTDDGDMPPRERAIHGLLGHDAARYLGLAECAAAWNHEWLSSLEELGIAKATQAGQAQAQLPQLLELVTQRYLFEGDGKLLLPVAAAVVRLAACDELTVAPAALVRACFSHVRLLEQT